MNDEEKAAEIQLLSSEVESIIKYSHLPARHEGQAAMDFMNIGAATSAVRARCRKILRLKGTGEEVIQTMTTTTQLMKAAGIDLNGKRAAE